MALPMASSGYSPQQQQMFQPFQVGSKGIKPVKKQSWLGDVFLGEKEQFQRTPTQTPQGMNALDQLLEKSSQNLQNPYQGWDPIEQRAKNRFQSESIPGLAERFTSMGGSDTRGSSDFAGMLGGAQADFDLGLEGLRTQYGQQNQQNALDQLRVGLTPQFETQHKDRGKGAIEKTFESIPKMIELMLKFL